MTLSPRVSVVIVTHNSLPYLVTCLTSLYACHDMSQLEVIVVDNESSDGTPAWVAQNRTQVRLISMAGLATVQTAYAETKRTTALSRHSFAAANNCGLAAARGEYLLLLNPDTVFREASCHLVADYLDANAVVGAAACQLRNSDGSVQHSCRAFPSLGDLFWRAILVGAVLPLPLRPAYYQTRLWTHDSERPVDQPAGAFLMVRRTVLDKVGPLDERFPLYYEDVDWCYRIRSAGWPIMFWPGTSVMHVGGASTSPLYPAAVRQMHLSLIMYFEKHYGARAASQARLLSLIAIPSHVALWAAQAMIRPADRRRLGSMISAHLRLLTFEMSRVLGRSR